MLQLISQFFKRSSASIIGRTNIALETERRYHDERVRTLEETIAVMNEDLRQHKEARAAYDDALLTLAVSNSVGDGLSAPMLTLVGGSAIEPVDHETLSADIERDIAAAKAAGFEYASAIRQVY